MSNEKLNNISNLIDKLIDIVNGNIKSKHSDHIKRIKKIIKKIFSINVNFAIKSLLNNYDLFSDVEGILDIIWDNIKHTVKDYIHVFVIMMAEIRVKLIKSIDSAIDRRTIYYNVDIDTIIKEIRNNTFDIGEFNKVFKIIALHTGKLNNSVQYHVPFPDFSKESINNIMLAFKDIFNTLYNK